MAIEIDVVGGDINDVEADVVAIPIEARLGCRRAVAKAVLGACAPSVAESLGRLRSAIPSGLAPGAVVALPAEGHRRFQLLLLVVLFDDRGPMHGAGPVEPDEARIELAARSMWEVLRTHHDGSLAVVPFAGRVVDTGEAAAVMARLFAADPASSSVHHLAVMNPRRVRFVERDPILRRDVRAAIESLGVEVVGEAEPELT